MDKERVNLTKPYLEKINTLISKFQILYTEETGKFPSDTKIEEELHLLKHDIRNSKIILDTAALENTNYAISIGFTKSYAVYVRIHILDTTLLFEESVNLRCIKNNKINASKEVKKALKFRKEGTYPVLTYQLQIKKGEVQDFKIYESVIKIDRIITNQELIRGNSDAYLKNMFGYLLSLRNYYNIEEFPYDMKSMEKIIQISINIELKKYVEKKNLPVVYFTELEMSEQEKVALHYQVCHHLMAFTKNEANDIFRQLENLKITRYFNFEPQEESTVEIDSENYFGYLNSSIIKCSLKEKMYFYEALNEYKKILEEEVANLDQEDLFLDYFSGRKLVRSLKEREIKNN